MKKTEAKSGISSQIHKFIRGSFHPHFGQLTSFKSNPVWQQLGKLGSRLWFDTGNIDEAHQRWTKEFSALTTHNVIANTR